ncbi:molybdopterin molybdotransferase MoeA [Aspergillus stella-maris]|uniref:molybdopterin molybdotransferase MoeA n=1 Tax=Aspergillus stella-maris TaxID=1810926 RepID=UPI003CCDD30E
MGLSYTEAVRLVEGEAEGQKLCQTETLAQTIHSPISTPQYDTSAMDGFALGSIATETATPESPVTFEVVATTTAGDRPHSPDNDLRDGIPPCVEIMTGAPFPLGRDADIFDCTVPVEDVVVTENKFSSRRYISVSKAARPRQHRRLAGGDFRKADLIVEAGGSIQPQHIMAMASVGFIGAQVVRRPRVAVFSTGCEVVSQDNDRSHPFMINDANGPYLTSMLGKWGVDVDFRGVVRDDREAMEGAILSALEEQYDVIITSGAVSAGRCDIIPSLIKRIGGRTVFHKVAVKPGHPILFSMLPRGTGESAFFGLPGNPVAAAACLRFFTLRYLRSLQGQTEQEPRRASLRLSPPDEEHLSPCDATKSQVLEFKPEPDIFRPAVLSKCGQEVWIIDDHSPGKTRPFLQGNSWVHIPSGVSEVQQGSQVTVLPFS